MMRGLSATAGLLVDYSDAAWQTLTHAYSVGVTTMGAGPPTFE